MEEQKQKAVLNEPRQKWWLVEIWNEKRETFKAFIEHALLFAFPIGILVLFHYLFEIIPLSPERKHILDTIDFVSIVAALVIFQVSFVMKIFVLALRRQKMKTNDSGSTTKGSAQSRVNKYDQLLEHLYRFYFEERRAQYLLYALTFLVSVAYASIGILALGRAEQSVVFDCIIFAVIFLIGLPVAYCLGMVYADARAHSSELVNSGHPGSLANTTADRRGSVA